MDYTIEAKPTTYNGRRYRSRLEAKWAAFFDLLNWRHEYEPEDLGLWSPDFALIGFDGRMLYCEVKPTAAPEREVSFKMSKLQKETLFLGVTPLLWADRFGVGLGVFINHEPAIESENKSFEEIATLCRMNFGSYGLVSTEGDWRDRISGRWDGQNLIERNGCALTVDEVAKLWSAASNTVQWLKR